MVQSNQNPKLLEPIDAVATIARVDSLDAYRELRRLVEQHLIDIFSRHTPLHSREPY